MSAIMKLEPLGIQKSISNLLLSSYSTNTFRNFSNLPAYSIMYLSYGADILIRDCAMAISITL